MKDSFYLFIASICFSAVVRAAPPLGQHSDPPILKPWYYVKAGPFDRGGCDEYASKLQESYVEVIEMAHS
jgi:hypothetical protein